MISIRGNNGIYRGGEGNDGFTFGVAGTTGTSVEGGVGTDSITFTSTLVTLTGLETVERLIGTNSATDRGKVSFTGDVYLQQSGFQGHLDLIVGNPFGGMLLGPQYKSSYIGTSSLRLFGSAGDDSIYGSDEADEIFGLGGEDYLNGDEGNDFITGGAGYDMLDGGYAGDDIALYSGLSSGYTITHTDWDIEVRDIYLADGDDGTDWLTEIERVRFADGVTVDLVPPEYWSSSTPGGFDDGPS